jgi:hypothetical protein
VVKKTPAPDAYSPDKPGLRVTVSGEEIFGQENELREVPICSYRLRIAEDMYIIENK